MIQTRKSSFNRLLNVIKILLVILFKARIMPFKIEWFLNKKLHCVQDKKSRCSFHHSWKFVNVRIAKCNWFFSEPNFISRLCREAGIKVFEKRVCYQLWRSLVLAKWPFCRSSSLPSCPYYVFPKLAMGSAEVLIRSLGISTSPTLKLKNFWIFSGK